MFSTVDSTLLFFSYCITGIFMLGVFTLLYNWITPYDDLADINNGKISSAISLGTAKLAFIFPILIASYYGTSYIEYVEIIALSGAVQLLYCFGIGLVLTKPNAATAIYQSFHSICIGLIIAFSMIP